MFEYIDIDQENIVIYIDMVILENIDIDMVILKNIDIEINIDIRENIAIDIYLYKIAISILSLAKWVSFAKNLYP